MCYLFVTYYRFHKNIHALSMCKKFTIVTCIAQGYKIRSSVELTPMNEVAHEIISP